MRLFYHFQTLCNKPVTNLTWSLSYFELLSLPKIFLLVEPIKTNRRTEQTFWQLHKRQNREKDCNETQNTFRVHDREVHKKTFRDFQETFWDFQWLSETFKRLSENFRDFQKLSETFKDFFETFKTLHEFDEVLWTRQVLHGKDEVFEQRSQQEQQFSNL